MSDMFEKDRTSMPLMACSFNLLMCAVFWLCVQVPGDNAGPVAVAVCSLLVAFAALANRVLYERRLRASRSDNQ